TRPAEAEPEHVVGDEERDEILTPEPTVVAEPADVEEPATEPALVAEPAVVRAPVEPSLVAQAWAVLTGGNPLARIGIAMLFLGLVFLVGYATEQGYLSLEVRLVAT